jgi:hypothetical protein
LYTVNGTKAVTWFSSYVAADFIKICKRSDPGVNECITNSVEQLKPALENGEICS